MLDAGQKHMETSNGNLTYPYLATALRKKQIVDGIKSIEIGMTIDDVIHLLGKPDEVHELYPSKSSEKAIGFTYWYIIQRMKGNGSVAEKAEHLVRISFNLNGIVIRKDQW